MCPTSPSQQRFWLLNTEFYSFAWWALWLEALHCHYYVLGHLNSALTTEKPHVGLTFKTSGWQHDDDSIFRMLVWGPSPLFLEVQEFHLSGCQADRNGQRNRARNASSQWCNPIHWHHLVRFLIPSELYLHQCKATLQLQKVWSKQSHFSIPPDYPKFSAISKLPRRSL